VLEEDGDDDYHDDSDSDCCAISDDDNFNCVQGSLTECNNLEDPDFLEGSEDEV
jgi:hypothetical protein